MAGPLDGLKVIEMAGIGPAPFACMLLADLGAQVLRVQRPGAPPSDPHDVTGRGRQVVALDLRRPGAAECALDLVQAADVLVEGFRPGVMERLGLGPQTCLVRNPRLVYGRMTGWGQHGPLAQSAGHDINYIAISGALHAIGRASEAPVPPLNYVGDYGGGALMLAFGVMCAVFESRRSGRGQVIDAAMSDGSALLSAMFYGMRAAGLWPGQRGENLLDGGAPYYGTYACADGKYIAIGALEPQFYARLMELCGIHADPALDSQTDTARWPLQKLRMADVFLTRTRAEWCTLLEGSDACFAPVLDWDEAPRHAHNLARETFLTLDGVQQPAPAPRFSRTPADAPRSARPCDPAALVRDWGVSGATVERLFGTVQAAPQA